jgi:hypothetical protein
MTDAYLPTDSNERKEYPIITGVLDYFPLAIMEVAKVSLYGSRKHNGDAPMHWERSKSTDEIDALGRHIIERGGVDPATGLRHSACRCWRDLADLQKEMEEALGKPISRGSRLNGKTAEELANPVETFYPANTSPDVVTSMMNSKHGIFRDDLPEIKLEPANTELIEATIKLLQRVKETNLRDGRDDDGLIHLHSTSVE